MAETAPTPQGPSDSRRHRDREGASLIVGILLILLGAAFFLERSGYVRLTDNWWAIFIYVAAVACFANAWRSCRASGVFGAQATGSLTWGLVLTVVGSIFWFNLLWDVWWPTILIAVGAGIVAGYILGALSEKPADANRG
jgi:hypothetical protein